MTGFWLLVRPFFPSGKGWEWRLDDAAELRRGTINAQVVSVGPEGAILTRQGERAISVISPSLSRGSHGIHRALVQAALPSVAVGAPLDTRVNFLWQAEDLEKYRFVSHVFPLDGRLTTIDFDLPVEPSSLHRIGVQFPDAPGAVRVRAVSMPVDSTGENLRAAARQLAEREPIDDLAINHIVGPRPLGRGLNDWLIAAIMASGGGVVFIRLARCRSIRIAHVSIVLAVAWLVTDAWATVNLGRQFRDDVGALRDKSPREQVASMFGDETAWVYAALLDRMRPGESFAVVGSADRVFAAAHRLGYLLTPGWIRRDDPARVDFIVVMHPGGVQFNDGDGTLTFPDGTQLTARLVVRQSEDVYILRRATP